MSSLPRLPNDPVKVKIDGTPYYEPIPIFKFDIYSFFLALFSTASCKSSLRFTAKRSKKISQKEKTSAQIAISG
ncbi:putative uncharacterized protein [Waddlia chondrophila 2032/99]|uniref:Uncharacterized protein n=1 Tax=Waddlia chondrophila 2032/99 TaxID=765953 RepID=F8LB22_9BACT|nr:putative uncharacterized protein [Waddlia chondrophila 2032/99]